MTKFQWDTEEDHDWEEMAIEPQSLQPRWRKLLLPLVVLLLLLAGGYAVYERIANTVSKVTLQTEDEIRATVALLYERAAAGDVELFGAMLSSNDRSWSATQQQMMAGDGLLDRSALGLTLIDAVPKIAGIELNAELTSAEITTTVRYQTTHSQTIELNLPIVMRKGSRLWLYASPTKGDAKAEDEAFQESANTYWGTLREGHKLRYFEVSYFERDAAIVTRLMRDLNDGIDRLCEQNRELCREKLPRFEPWFMPDAELLDPNSESNENMPVYRSELQAGYQAPFSLPTPSLIGLPTDEASYQALLHGYAQQIITPALTQMLGYECCQHQMYAEALAERMMIEAGLQAEVLSAESYQNTLLNSNFDYESPPGWDKNETSAESRSQQAHAAAIAQFLTSEFRLDPASGLSLLSNHRWFDEWLAFALSEDTITELVTQADWPDGSNLNLDALFFMDFAPFLIESGDLYKARSELNAPYDYPDVAVGLSCNSNRNGQFLRWDVPTNQFETVYSAADGFIGWGERDKASGNFLLLEYPQLFGAGQGARIVLLNQGEATVIHSGNYASTSGFFGYNASAGSATSFVDYDSQSRDIIQFDLTQCDGENCPFTQYDGVPIVSPDGDKTLVVSWNGTPGITVLDSDGELLFERMGYTSYGSRNFWFSNEEIAVVSASNGSLETLTIATGASRTIIDKAVFERALEAVEVESSVRFNFEYALNEQNSAEIFVVASRLTTSVGQEQHSFIYDLEQSAITFYLPNRQIQFASPDNKNLSVIKTEGSQEWQRSNINRETGDEYVFPSLGFNQSLWLDENWLLLTNYQYTLLIAPEQNYFEFVTLPDSKRCTSATLYR